MYVILRSGCHECGEPVDLVGAYVDQDEARDAAIARVQEGQPWFEIALEVWSVEPGKVKCVLNISHNPWSADGFQLWPTGGER